MIRIIEEPYTIGIKSLSRVIVSADGDHACLILYVKSPVGAIELANELRKLIKRYSEEEVR